MVPPLNTLEREALAPRKAGGQIMAIMATVLRLERCDGIHEAAEKQPDWLPGLQQERTLV